MSADAAAGGDIGMCLRLHRADGFTLALDLQMPAGGTTVLYGPSGSGKTTVLRCLAGLERARGARVAVGTEVWQDDARGVFVPTWRRAIGYVFQEASLFDHLDVAANLQYGLKRAGHRGASRTDLDNAIDLLGIGPLLARRPARLSGGERQRVAIARALAVKPRLLLLDEPLSALDVALRQDILPWLERVRNEAAVPMVYVTHSADEVARLADWLVLLDAGRVEDAGPVAEVLLRAELPGLAGDDAGVLLRGHIDGIDAPWRLARVGFDGGALWLRDPGLATGHAVRVRVLARDVSIALVEPQATSVQNRLACTVVRVAEDPRIPAQVLVQLRCGDAEDGAMLLARITARAAHELALGPGVRAWALLKSAALVH